MQIKDRQKLLVIVTIAAVALFAADHLIRAPLVSAWNARAAQLTKLHNNLARGQMLVQRERGPRGDEFDPASPVHRNVLFRLPRRRRSESRP